METQLITFLAWRSKSSLACCSTESLELNWVPFCCLCQLLKRLTSQEMICVCVCVRRESAWVKSVEHPTTVTCIYQNYNAALLSPALSPTGTPLHSAVCTSRLSSPRDTRLVTWSFSWMASRLDPRPASSLVTWCSLRDVVSWAWTKSKSIFYVFMVCFCLDILARMLRWMVFDWPSQSKSCDMLHSPFASSRSLWKCSVDFDPCPAPLPIVLGSDRFWEKLWNKPPRFSLCPPVKSDTNYEHLTDFVVSSLFILYSCPSKTWAIFSAPLVSVYGFICFSKLFTAIMFKTKSLL